MRVILCLGFLMFNAMPSMAGTLLVSDFNCNLEADVPAGSALGSIMVPDEVYMCSSRKDLGDLRVFGKNGILPHLIKRPSEGKGEVKEPASLPFFPVYSGEGGKAGVSVHLSAGSGGALVDLRTETDRRRTDSPSFWLIDASSLKEPLSGLVFDWSGPARLVFDINVEAGSDLSTWRRIKGPITLADLDYAGNRLTVRKADLPRTDDRYLRITWPAEAEGAALTSVKAIFPRPGKEPEMRWSEVEGKKSGSSPGKTAYEFDIKGHFPVERVDLVLPEGMDTIQAVLMSRPDLASGWVMRHLGVFYGMTVNGRVIKGGEASLPVIQDRFWRIETSSEAAFYNEASPSLRIGWVPHELVFVPSGNTSCILAFGRGGMSPSSDASVSALFSSLSADPGFKPSLAVISEEKNKGRKFDSSAWPFPFRKWILWAFLVLGVSIIAFMAWRLYRQMGNE